MSDALDAIIEGMRDPRLKWIAEDNGCIRAYKILKDDEWGTRQCELCPITGLYWLKTGHYLAPDRAREALFNMGYWWDAVGRGGGLIALAADDLWDPTTEQGRIRRRMIEALNAR